MIALPARLLAGQGAPKFGCCHLTLAVMCPFICPFFAVSREGCFDSLTLGNIIEVFLHIKFFM